MADKWPLADGVWSDASNWNDGTKPGVSDDVYADGHTVDIDEDVTVSLISTDIRDSGGSGGYFTTSGDRIVAANLQSASREGTSSCVISVSGFDDLTVVGNLLLETGSGNDSNTIIKWASVGALSITGSLANTGNRTNSSCLEIDATPSSCVVTGDVTAGGSHSRAYGIKIDSDVDMEIVGNIFAGIAEGMYNVSYDAAITVTGNVYANAENAGIYNASGSVTMAGNIVNDLITGWTGVFCPVILISGSVGLYWEFMSPQAKSRKLYSADIVPGAPAESDVRSGTVYGAGSDLTGSLAVPPAAAVGVGVPVDNTTGTAAVTQQAIADAVGPLLTAL